MSNYEQQVAAARDRFIADTTGHEMDVLRNDGMYRHVRFQKPGTSMYFFDIVTWPGHLVITGDCGDYHFSRITDMFEFFGDRDHGFADARWGITPGYWAEKLRGPGRDTARTYTEDVFRETVGEWLDQQCDGSLGGYDAHVLRHAMHTQVLDDPDGYLTDEGVARQRLNDFRHDEHYVSDVWEYDFREYTWPYLWCCWAIVWGIEQYRNVTVPA